MSEVILLNEEFRRRYIGSKDPRSDRIEPPNGTKGFGRWCRKGTCRDYYLEEVLGFSVQEGIEPGYIPVLGYSWGNR